MQEGKCKKSKISEMKNGWVARSRGAVAGAQAVGVRFRWRMGRSLVTHYMIMYGRIGKLKRMERMAMNFLLIFGLIGHRYQGGNGY